jgi:hypothetical protein
MATRQQKKGAKRKAPKKKPARKRPAPKKAAPVLAPVPVLERPKDPADERRPTPSAAWAASKKLCKFIVCLGHHGNVTWALRQSKLDRGYAYDRRGTDTEFASAWEEARKIGLDVLKDEAWRRAHEGVAEPKFHAGKVCGHVRRYSDALLMFLVKQHDPSYREHFDISLGNQAGRPFMFQMMLHPDAVPPATKDPK